MSVVVNPGFGDPQIIHTGSLWGLVWENCFVLGDQPKQTEVPYWLFSCLHYFNFYLKLLLSAHFPTDLMPPFIRHGPTIPRRAEVPLPDPPAVPGAGVYPLGTGAETGGRKSFLRNAAPRPPHEVSRRESHRLSAPPYLPRSLSDLPHDYSSSSPSFISDGGQITENGDTGRYYYAPEAYYDNQARRTRRPDHFHEDYRYYEHSELNYRAPPQPHTPQPHIRPPAGECFTQHTSV